MLSILALVCVKLKLAVLIIFIDMFFRVMMCTKLTMTNEISAMNHTFFTGKENGRGTATNYRKKKWSHLNRFLSQLPVLKCTLFPCPVFTFAIHNSETQNRCIKYLCHGNHASLHHNQAWICKSGASNLITHIHHNKIHSVSLYISVLCVTASRHGHLCFGVRVTWSFRCG